MVSAEINLEWKMTLMTLLIWSISTVIAVPLSIEHLNDDININNSQLSLTKENNSKNIEELICLVNGSAYKDGEYVLGVAGPCEECMCHPPDVICSMMKCPSNIGCITLQLPNKCCPTYKCDCEYKGKLYNNGEKINSYDDSACRVCYCNGGEIVCTSIICYTRNDCKGYTLPGECCPKYDNCSTSHTDYKNKGSNDFGRSLLKNILKSFTTTDSNLESIWKRDTIKNQQFNTPASSTISPIDSNFLNINAQISTIENNTTEIVLYDNLNSSSVEERDVVEKSTTLFFDLKNDIIDDELSKHENISFDNKEKFNILFFNTEPNSYTDDFYEKIETTTEIDNSIIITHSNGTESVVDVDETFAFSTVDPPALTTYFNSDVDIFDPKELKKTKFSPKMELFTNIIDFDETSTIDDSISRELTTPSSMSRESFSSNPLNQTSRILQGQDDENNTDIIFTDQDTIDMLGQNYGYEVDDMERESLIDEFENNTQLKITTDNTVSLSTIENKNNENVNVLDYENNTLTTEINDDLMTKKFNLDINTNDSLEIPQNYSANHVNLSKETEKSEKNCSNCNKNKHFNDENVTHQPETTVPFIITAKAVTDQTKFRYIDQSLPYPEEYPEEYETIQSGPSLTITRKTYTSIPDVIYTTTTMITLPTLDMIYKASKELENYLSGGNKSSITKPQNSNLKPLKNISSSTL